jgi:hypothetical protein
MAENKLGSISQTDSLEAMGEFWDTHDFTDFDDPNMPDIEFEMACVVPIEAELFAALEKQARQRGVQVETLVNLWLQQKLTEQLKQAA